MARLYEPSTEEEAIWKQWVSERPENVRVVAERFDKWTLYRIKGTNRRVTLYSFREHEDGSVTMAVNLTGQFNLVLFSRAVFGINPSDLVECDLPTEHETLGVILNEEEELEYINAERQQNDLPPLPY